MSVERYTPLIIVGAPRSGTNMLRDVLTRLDGVSTWPCDEINYIWRHGNVRESTDEFSADMATPELAGYIRKQFDWVSQRYDAHTVVEKTCANSLRVPFIDKVMPEARYVFIYRDGLDVVGSALKRWKAELDIPYLARKARFVPLADLPYYASKYLWNRLYRVLSKKERLAFWGPQFEGLDAALQQYSLPEVCALQWQRCVTLSEGALTKIDESRVSRVSYESFVAQPERELMRINSELDLNLNTEKLSIAVADVSSRNVGKGRANLDKKTASAVVNLVGETLDKYGYARY